MKTPFWIATLALLFLLGGATLQLQAQPHERPDHGNDALGEHPDGPPLFDEGDAGPRDGRGYRMNDQEIETAYDIVVQLYPELAERLEAQREQDPRQLRNTLERQFPRVRFLVRLQERDPEMFDLRMADIKLDRQTQALASQLRQARENDDDTREDELVDMIETKVAEHFDVRQQIRASEIEKLKQKLEELEERLDDRDDDRKDLIEQRVEELIGSDW